MKTINCEVTKVFDRDPSKKTQGFSFRPLEMTEENIEYFQSFDKSKWDNKFKSIACNIFHNNKPNPDWLAEGSFEDDVEQLDDDFVAEELEKELNTEQKQSLQDQKKERMIKRIESLVNNYGEVFKVVNAHNNLVSLDTSLKKDIATHINITLSNEGY